MEIVFVYDKKIKWTLLVPLNFNKFWAQRGLLGKSRKAANCLVNFTEKVLQTQILTDKSSDIEEVGHVLFLPRLFSSLMFIPP